jgi:hypothetical protein
MGRFWRLVAVGVMSAGFVQAGATQTPHLDPDVHAVISGGRWSSPTGNGWYRAVIRTGGFEHVVSSLTLDWMQSATDSASATTVVASVKVELCTGRLDDPEFGMRRSVWRLTVRCTDTHSVLKPFDAVVTLGAPGRYSLPSRR